MRALAILLLLASTIVAAPVPKAKPRWMREPQIEPGHYLMTWHESKGACTLDKSGKFGFWYNGEYCMGDWKWDRETRVFTYIETHCNWKKHSNPLVFTFKLLPKALRTERPIPYNPEEFPCCPNPPPDQGTYLELEK